MLLFTNKGWGVKFIKIAGFCSAWVMEERDPTSPAYLSNELNRWSKDLATRDIVSREIEDHYSLNKCIGKSRRFWESYCQNNIYFNRLSCHEWMKGRGKIYIEACSDYFVRVNEPSVLGKNRIRYVFVNIENSMIWSCCFLKKKEVSIAQERIPLIRLGCSRNGQNIPRMYVDFKIEKGLELHKFNAFGVRWWLWNRGLFSSTLIWIDAYFMRTGFDWQVKNLVNWATYL
jgi:hypothetical protein